MAAAAAVIYVVQVDLYEKAERFGERMLDMIERHPVGPFLSFHHPSRVFDANLVSPVRFFEGMHHDPASFAQLLLLEVPRSLVSVAVSEQRGRPLPPPLLQLERLCGGSVIRIGGATRHNLFSAFYLLRPSLAPRPHLQSNPSAAPHGFAAAVASGVSVRLWLSGAAGTPHDAATALLWDQTRVDVLSWPQEVC